MAQTKKKRKTKHRGNAAGMIEARGRTGRKPAAGETSKGASGRSAKPANRYDEPPTWRGAAVRAVLAAGAFFGILVLFLKRPLPASATISVLMIAAYTPLGYWTDMWIHRRRVKKARPASGGDER